MVRRELDLKITPRSIDVICASADDPVKQQDIGSNVCVTDPPYFDYIAYSELSEFFGPGLMIRTLQDSPCCQKRKTQ